MHFMPARCKFRADDDRALSAPPELPSAAAPRPAGLCVELPPVIPLLGAASPTLRSNGEESIHNNWMLPGEQDPRVVDAKFDSTPVRTKEAAAWDMAAVPRLGGRFAHSINASGWVDELCFVNPGVDPKAGVVDKSKCKHAQLKGNTALLRILEYHTSKLRRNLAAHEMREHEELELVYLLRGTLLITLKQPSSKHSRVLYRRLLDEGDLAYYPGWQAHGLMAVERPQAVYLAIRYLGRRHGAPRGLTADKPRFWRDLHRRGAPSHSLGRGKGSLRLSKSIFTTVSDASNLSTRPDLALGRNKSNFDTLLLLTRGSVQYSDGAHLDAPATLFLPSNLRNRPLNLRCVKSKETKCRIVRVDLEDPEHP